MLIRLLLLPLLFALSLSALADEAAIKKAVEARMPGAKVAGVVQTPYAGLYEVQVDGNLLYVDEQVRYILVGSLYDGQTLDNLTEARMRAINRIKFSDLPFSQSIRIVKGKGTRQLAYFSDPNCPYCKRLEHVLAGMDDLTLYVFLYPILSPDSMTKSQAIWCARDRAQAWTSFMLDGKALGNKTDCDTPVRKNLQLGQKLGVRATPTLFFVNGERVAGALGAEDLNKLLDGAQAGKQ